jgi:methoxymalonate biosynthesis protein
MSKETSVQKVAVVGAGVMGTGLAALITGHGLAAHLVDTDEAALAGCAQRVDAGVRTGRLFRALPTDVPTGELTFGRDLAGLGDVQVAIESVPELPELKYEVLAAMAAAVRPGTLLISNTSAIPIEELAKSVVRPQELAGTHFMNPPYMIRGVEVVRGPHTGQAAMDTLYGLLDRLGRKPVTVADGPGFVANRILMRVINDAAKLVAEGNTGARQVDDVFTLCFGHRTGPLSTADLIGLDSVVDTLRVLFDRTGDPSYRACDLLVDKVAAGDLGRKTGQGFYNYGKEPA